MATYRVQNQVPSKPKLEEKIYRALVTNVTDDEFTWKGRTAKGLRFTFKVGDMELRHFASFSVDQMGEYIAIGGKLYQCISAVYGSKDSTTIQTIDPKIALLNRECYVKIKHKASTKPNDNRIFCNVAEVFALNEFENVTTPVPVYQPPVQQPVQQPIPQPVAAPQPVAQPMSVPAPQPVARPVPTPVPAPIPVPQPITPPVNNAIDSNEFDLDSILKDMGE